MSAHPYLTVVTHRMEPRACNHPQDFDAASPHGEERWPPGDHEAIHQALCRLQQASWSTDRWIIASGVVFLVALVGWAVAPILRGLGWI